MRQLLFVLVCLAAISSVWAQEQKPAAATAPDSGKSPTAKELRAAPEAITIGDRKLVLQADLWRDFMPISPPDGKPLIAVLKLKTTDAARFPEGVAVESVWIVNGEEVWSAAAKEVRKPNDDVSEGPGPSTMEICVRNGPKWGPGIKVDVVIGVKDAQGQLHLLKAPGQDIGRTD